MDYFKEIESKVKPLVEWLKNEFTGIRTNRPSPKLLENIKVNYLGQELLVKQLGSITIEPPRTLLVTSWDKTSVNAISKAIESANLGVSTAITDHTIRVSLPDLTEERKKELIKLVKSMAEETRIKIRAARDSVNKKVNELEDEDMKFKAKEQIQKGTDAANNEIERILEEKTKEINE